MKSYLKKPITKKRDGGMSQGAGPQLKPQYYTHKKRKNYVKQLIFPQIPNSLN
jgi:hypothetical protein